MGGGIRPFIDLNEPPAEEEEETTVQTFSQPHKSLPSARTYPPNLLFKPESSHRIVNNNAFSHASLVSGFQPFVRVKDINKSKDDNAQGANDAIPRLHLPSTAARNTEENESDNLQSIDDATTKVAEREEGEWSDMEVVGGNELVDSMAHFKDEESVTPNEHSIEKQEIGNSSHFVHGNSKDGVSNVSKEDNSVGLSREPVEQSHESSSNANGIAKEDISIDGSEESVVVKQKDVKKIEASHGLRCANNPGKRNKFDEHKEAMLGKKRSRQTRFLNPEEVKQASIKTTTPRRQSSLSTLSPRVVKETIRPVLTSAERIGERQGQSGAKDNKPHEDVKRNDNSDVSLDMYPAQGSRPGFSKPLVDARQLKNQPILGRKPAVSSPSLADTKLTTKKHPPPKKPNTNSATFQDTSVERLLREVTNDKFWHNPEKTALRSVPGTFESVEEYVRVFEPLLFEECRAQLYSTWEELAETVSRDAHVRVRIKNIERRERGWYDVIVIPLQECKWNFKEGDVAILSLTKPGSGGSYHGARSKRNNASINEDDEEAEVTARVAGTVRRHSPIDTRDPPGAILHFYVGDTYDSSSKIDEDHVLRKIQPKGIWYLTVLGSLATTQREYVALHAFRRLNIQMQTAILKPSANHFPKYKEQAPGMPECFTSNFVDYLRRTFNGPQLSAIQWAAMHTAAGTSSSGVNKRQEPWPFTLVQGPPGTGKTHTVWGMLNVIHLVQYQHYYAALLKKLAPESYKQANENNSESVRTGSIDEVLQSMDQNLLRILPKLCPKPRMLVCAPSNAATDELLARVLGRGFIDGEMKVYRPDVARVGVDSQTRAAQAVSVERRTEQLLGKSREDIVSCIHHLKTHEAQFSHQIACLQRELNIAAQAVRSQGSVGVDPDVLIARDRSRDTLLQNLAAVVESRDKVLVEMSRLLILEGRFRPGYNFNLEEARASLEASFANEAEIVFTTVSSSGRKLFSRLAHGFDMVVIDEAAQASEVAALPPLSLGAARCVLVGDPQQLPATVISKAAGTLLYSRSLFERFQQAGCPTMLLSVQYRMHPQIRDFPSRYFYQGRLTDSESVANMPEEIYYKDPLLKPYVFYDITHGRESHKGGSVSYQNVHEAQFCLRIYEHLQNIIKSLGGNKVSVGIITPYKLQLRCLQREFEEVMKTEEGKDLYINTVDAFQGQERDVIIMSCVRASKHGVGFVSDIRRMNVALTRARRALWVMGNANALMQSEDWASLIKDAKSRNCFVDMDTLPKDFLIPTQSTNTPLQSKPSNMRVLRSSGLRQRHMDVLPESKSDTPSEDDEKSNTSMARNGNYRT